MALTDCDSIDLITKPLPGDEECRLVLYVVDDGSVVDENERYRLLVVKLASYLQYVSSPGFASENPGVGLSDVLVRVLCKTPASDTMLDIKTISPKGDARIGVRVLFENYADFVGKLKK